MQKHPSKPITGGDGRAAPHQRSPAVTPFRESLFLGSCGCNVGLCPAPAAQISAKVSFLYNRGGMHPSMRKRQDARCL